MFINSKRPSPTSPLIEPLLRDRNQVIVQGDAATLDLLRAHPDVVKIEPLAMDSWAVHLKPLSVEEQDNVQPARDIRGSAAPDREPDLEFYGHGEPHATLWDRYPGLQYYEQLYEPDSDEYNPFGWWSARIWLSAHERPAGEADVRAEYDRRLKLIPAIHREAIEAEIEDMAVELYGQREPTARQWDHLALDLERVPDSFEHGRESALLTAAAIRERIRELRTPKFTTDF